MPDEPFSSPPGEYDATIYVEAASSNDDSAQQETEDAAANRMNAPEENPMPEAEVIAEVPPPKDEAEPKTARAKTAASEAPTSSLAVMTSTVAGLERMITQSFTNPESTKAACRSLIDSSDDKGLWLASLVQPSHLSEELRQNCSDLSTLVIMQWVRQGETHKLKQLGDILLVEEPRKITHETAQIMVVLAGLLGILRPLLAQRLLTSSTPHMKDLTDSGLMRDARMWVEAGSVLEGSTPEQRIFWNRRLREPNADWDWETAEARLALNHLASRQPVEEADLQLFQNAVPGCWWDLWRSRVALDRSAQSPAAHTTISAGSARSGFGRGVLIGAAAALALGWLGMTQMQSPPAVIAAVPVQKVIEVKSEMLVEDETPAPPIRESLLQLQAALRAAPKPAATNVASTPASPLAPNAQPAPAQAASAPGLSKEMARKQAALAFASSHADIKRLALMVRDGSYRENERLIQGGHSMAPGGSPAYRSMIHWLVLDPPVQADTRLVVTKTALRAMPITEVAPLFDLCYYPGSPNEIEVKQCSALLLELPVTGMTADHQSKLNAIVSAP